MENEMKLNLIFAAVFAAVAIAAGAATVSAINAPKVAFGHKHAASFDDRYSAIKELDEIEMPALRKWMAEYGVTGDAPVVATGQ
jgi:hypothetical protein